MLIEDMTLKYFKKHFNQFDDDIILPMIIEELLKSPNYYVIEDYYNVSYLIIDTDKKVMDNLYEKLRVFDLVINYSNFKEYYIMCIT